MLNSYVQQVPTASPATTTTRTTACVTLINIASSFLTKSRRRSSRNLPPSSGKRPVPTRPPAAPPAAFKSQRDFVSQPKVGAPAPTLGHHPTNLINPNGVAANVAATQVCQRQRRASTPAALTLARTGFQTGVNPGAPFRPDAPILSPSPRQNDEGAGGGERSRNLRKPSFMVRANQTMSQSLARPRAPPSNPNGILAHSPTVARHELPWVSYPRRFQPHRGCGRALPAPTARESSPIKSQALK